MTKQEVVEMLRDEAGQCLKSSIGNGAYNDAFYVAHIVLQRIAQRLSRIEEASAQEVNHDLNT